MPFQRCQDVIPKGGFSRRLDFWEVQHHGRSGGLQRLVIVDDVEGCVDD